MLYQVQGVLQSRFKSVSFFCNYGLGSTLVLQENHAKFLLLLHYLQHGFYGLVPLQFLLVQVPNIHRPEPEHRQRRLDYLIRGLQHYCNPGVLLLELVVVLLLFLDEVVHLLKLSHQKRLPLQEQQQQSKGLLVFHREFCLLKGHKADAILVQHQAGILLTLSHHLGKLVIQKQIPQIVQVQILAQRRIKRVRLEVEVVCRNWRKLCVCHLDDSQFLSVELDMEKTAKVGEDLTGVEVQAAGMHCENALTHDEGRRLTLLDQPEDDFKLRLGEPCLVFKPGIVAGLA